MARRVPVPSGDGDHGTTVLIVDDDLKFGQLATDLLTDRGYRVVGLATTAAEAATKCDRLGPDAVLLDARLPDGIGLTVAETLRASSGRPKILLTSVDRDAVTPRQLRESALCGFVPKTELVRSDLDSYLRR